MMVTVKPDADGSVAGIVEDDALERVRLLAALDGIESLPIEQLVELTDLCCARGVGIVDGTLLVAQDDDAIDRLVVSAKG